MYSTADKWFCPPGGERCTLARLRLNLSFRTSSLLRELLQRPDTMCRGRLAHAVMGLAISEVRQQKQKGRASMMKWNATVILTGILLATGEVRLQGILLGLSPHESGREKKKKTHLNMQMYSADWQPGWRRATRQSTLRQVRFAILRLFFCLSAPPPKIFFLSKPLLGTEQRQRAPARAQSENRSNHLFIDWNIRGVRGGEGVGATKSGKDRLAGGWRAEWGAGGAVGCHAAHLKWRKRGVGVGVGGYSARCQKPPRPHHDSVNLHCGWIAEVPNLNPHPSTVSTSDRKPFSISIFFSSKKNCFPRGFPFSRQIQEATPASYLQKDTEENRKWLRAQLPT